MWKRLLGNQALLAAVGAAFCVPIGNSLAQAPVLEGLGLSYAADFEKGTTGDLVMSGNWPTPTQELARTGTWALRSFLDRKNSSTSYRTEVEVLGNQKIGEVFWSGISIYLPETHTKSDVWEVVFQMHDRPNDWNNVPPGRQGIFAVESTAGVGGKWRIWGLYNSTYNGGGDTQKTAFDVSAGEIKAGWNDFVFNWRWAHSPGQGGFTKVWVNGTQLVDYTGPNCYNDDIGPYAKFGIYKGWRDRVSPTDTVQTRLVYHDEYRVAGANGTYEMVAPRGGAAAPKPKPKPKAPVFLN